MNKLLELREKKAALVARAQEILDAVDESDDADADLTEDQQTEFDSLQEQIAKAQKQIERHEAMLAHQASRPRVEPEPDISGGHDRREDDPTRGFANFGEFLKAVRDVPINHTVDDRLRIGAAAPTTFGNEGTGADGGFLVPPTFASDVFTLSLEGESFLPMTDQIPIDGNSMVFPADETTPWGTGGVQARWESEATAATQDKPVLKQKTQRMHKLISLVPVTDELMADASALSTYLTGLMARAIRWKSNDALVNGSGAGQPLGILDAANGALVSVAKEGSQVADTIVAENVAKMYARMPASSVPTAVWVVNQDALPQLLVMTLGDNTIYVLPREGFTQAPGGFLLGRPVIFSQHAQTVGDKGDIILVDWRMYRTITKRGGIETATSMHVFFDAAATAFRAIFRLDGQPVLDSSITPANGSNNLSPYVTLDERA